MRRYAASVALAALATFPAAGAAAQEKEAEPVRELSPVEITRKKNPGDLRYHVFFDMQSFVQSLMPPEPRTIDLQLRVKFTSVTGAARDDYLPDTWAVAIVGDTIDQTVPVSRGGYFLLPELKQDTAQGATIMFNTQTRKRVLGTAWKLRLTKEQTLPYAQFAKALDEVKSVQNQIPWYRLGLRGLRLVSYNSLRACFGSEGGRIDVGGQPADTIVEGGCQVLKFDPAIAREGQVNITFAGPLDIVTLHEVSK